MSLCKRENGGVFIIKDGRINFFSGKKYLKIKSEAEPEFEGEIVGTVAFRGVARGKATIHLGWINTTEVPEGNILIAGMTNPQMVPYIRSASAIVTDEGGLTCHAAIIAREMKIPCVVGTKVATRVIKDGDLVEVDAEKGVVRIIRKQE